MYETLKGMLANKRKSVKTQTDKACMNNAVLYDYDGRVSTASESKDDEAEASAKEKDDKEELHRVMRLKGYTMDEESEQPQLTANSRNNLMQSTSKKSILKKGAGKSQLDVQAGEASANSRGRKLSKGPNKVSAIALSKADSTETIIRGEVSASGDMLEGTNVLVDAQGRADFNPVEQPQAYANLSMRQLGLKNALRMKTLAKKFDDVCAKIKKRKMFENNADPSKINKSQEWRIPYKVIAFIETQILEYDKSPEKVEKYELLEWDYFKSIIFEIYDHRIKHAPELNGSANLNYVAMNEHILLYFVDKYRTRRKAEVGIVDLLINTRYYYEYWQRAKTFADTL